MMGTGTGMPKPGNHAEGKVSSGTPQNRIVQMILNFKMRGNVSMGQAE